MEENGLVLGEIMQSPAEGLIKYYQEEKFLE
jgi:hypothetical protein